MAGACNQGFADWDSLAADEGLALLQANPKFRGVVLPFSKAWPPPSKMNPLVGFLRGEWAWTALTRTAVPVDEKQLTDIIFTNEMKEREAAKRKRLGLPPME